jgi:predicted nuclease with RNAse H fold
MGNDGEPTLPTMGGHRMKRRAWVGIDPGGAHAFGVAIIDEDGEVATSCVSYADQAVDKITVLPLGVGVDAPLWWSSGPSAEREADRWIRRTYGIAAGTVQTPNSLRGAALVQGAMFVERLREKFPGVPVTETHPKAVAIALGGWESARLAGLGCRADLGEHERDAYLSAICAREGFSGRWTSDLSTMRSSNEQDPNRYWLAPIHYFWPEDIATGLQVKCASDDGVASTRKRTARRGAHDAPGLGATNSSVGGDERQSEGVVEIRDHVLWIKHIRGNPAMQNELLAMTAGSTVLPKVDGLVGRWVKMNVSKSGASTPGIKPIGQAKDHWQMLLENQRGAAVEISREP